MLSSEVRILCSLGGGSVHHKAFRNLRLTTGLSATWLSKKLEEMRRSGLVGMDGRLYTLAEGGWERFRRIGGYAYPLFLLEKASLFTDRISEVDDVEGVILFGSLAQGRGSIKSDVDVLIILKDGGYSEGLEADLREMAYEHEISGEVLLVEEASLDDYARRDCPLSLVFGILEDYEVLLDKHGRISSLLKEAEKRVREKYEYLEGARLWLKKS